MESPRNPGKTYADIPQRPVLHPIALPGLTIPGNIFSAPMAGYTDAAFRSVCIDKGVFFTWTEMVSAEALSRKNEKTLTLCNRAENEIYFGIQLFTSSATPIAQAVREIIGLAPSIIDLNCGCSIPKIVKSGSGAALLRNPRLIGKIIRTMKNETDIPLSIKIRSGWNEASLNYLEVCAAATEAGVSLVTLHPRTAVEVFKAKARWEHLAILKRESDIPVIGSGDLFTPDDACRMLATTGCDGVMIARGAIGNPFIFTEIRDLLTKGTYESDISAEERLGCAIDHLRRAVRSKGEAKACIEMRKHFCAYTRGLPDSSAIRQSCVRAKSLKEYEGIVKSYLHRGRELPE